MKKYLLILVFLPFLAGAQSSTEQSKLYGSWLTNDADHPMIIVFNQDGTADLDGDLVNFKTQGNQLVVTVDGEIEKYAFKFEGNTLVISGGDLEKPLKFQRRDSDSKSRQQKPRS